jgi:hypothetical protein
VTGHPSSGGNAAPRQLELARLRTFCVLNAVLYLIVAVLIAFLRLLLAQLVDEPVKVTIAFMAQEMLCSLALIALAVVMLWVRGAITRDPAGQDGAVRAGRSAGVFALVIAAIVAAGAVVVALVPATDSKVPTIVVSGLVVVFALYSYAGMAKLRQR